MSRSLGALLVLAAAGANKSIVVGFPISPYSCCMSNGLSSTGISFSDIRLFNV